MTSVAKLVSELQHHPRRFQSTGGYERLLDALQAGGSPLAVKQMLRTEQDLAGDILWTVAQLDEVEDYVDEASLHVTSSDKGTMAYAMEVVFRGAREPTPLTQALNQLWYSPDHVAEHVVRTLAGLGLRRTRDVLESGGWHWAADLATDLLAAPVQPDIIVELVRDPARDRQIVGLILATLAAEQDPRILAMLTTSEEHWTQNYIGWLAHAR